MNLSDNRRLSEHNGQTHQRWLGEMRHARSPPLPPTKLPGFSAVPFFALFVFGHCLAPVCVARH